MTVPPVSIPACRGQVRAKKGPLAWPAADGRRARPKIQFSSRNASVTDLHVHRRTNRRMKLFSRILGACACLFSLPLASHAASHVIISEFMASNRSTNLLNQVFGPTAFPGAPDWIEIRNVSGAPVNLLNWSLTDNAG